MAKKVLGKVVTVEKVWLSSREAKRFLGCSKDYLRELRENPDNRIVISILGPKTILYELKSLLRFIDRHKVTSRMK